MALPGAQRGNHLPRVPRALLSSHGQFACLSAWPWQVRCALAPGLSFASCCAQNALRRLPGRCRPQLPPGVKDMDVLLVDPMLATGGSCIMAIASLVDAGVAPERIIFLNVISCPEGLANLAKAYPMVSGLDHHLRPREARLASCECLTRVAGATCALSPRVGSRGVRRCAWSLPRWMRA